MLYVKIMSNQDLADTDPWHTYTIISVPDDRIMKFHRHPVPEGQVGHKDGERFSLEIHHPDGSVVPHFLTGNAYVMNEAGKTIASHGS
jgi:hypothetical protein